MIAYRPYQQHIDENGVEVFQFALDFGTQLSFGAGNTKDPFEKHLIHFWFCISRGEFCHIINDLQRDIQSNKHLPVLTTIISTTRPPITSAKCCHIHVEHENQYKLPRNRKATTKTCKIRKQKFAAGIMLM